MPFKTCVYHDLKSIKTNRYQTRPVDIKLRLFLRYPFRISACHVVRSGHTSDLTIDRLNINRRTLILGTIQIFEEPLSLDPLNP